MNGLRLSSWSYLAAVFVSITGCGGSERTARSNPVSASNTSQGDGTLWVRDSGEELVGCPTLYLQLDGLALVHMPTMLSRCPSGGVGHCVGRDSDGLYVMRTSVSEAGELVGVAEPFRVSLGTQTGADGERRLSATCQPPGAELSFRSVSNPQLVSDLLREANARDFEVTDWDGNGVCVPCFGFLSTGDEQGAKRCLDQCAYGASVGTPVLNENQDVVDGLEEED